MKSENTTHVYPVPPKILFRIMIGVIVFFSIMAGFYQSRFGVWKENNRAILEKFHVQSTQELLKKQVEVR